MLKYRKEKKKAQRNRKIEKKIKINEKAERKKPTQQISCMSSSDLY